MNRLIGFGMAAAVLSSFAALKHLDEVSAAAGGPAGLANDEYRVLAPIESGNLLLFPVVRAGGKSPGATPFLTLDEGIKSGAVEVTEAGRVQGLVRPRPGEPRPQPYPVRGDQVNTLVLVNNSDKPLLLLAGEIVTGGKQDRVIAKDRIVPPGADPIDLGVFCIEPGRWVASSDKFGSTAASPAAGFMVQPSVRQQAMVAKNQQEVWNSVAGTISSMAVAAAPPPGADTLTDRSLNTTSYAKAMQSSEVSKKVDEAAAPLMKSREQVLAQLRQQQAVGVVVAVRGELAWADIFASPELLAKYWTKLVRSYAAESLAAGEDRAAPTVADAQHFLDGPVNGAETSEGDVGVYRYTEVKSEHSETFVLESLLPSADYEVHISRVKLRGAYRHERPGILR
jgi:hypothetical protein